MADRFYFAEMLAKLSLSQGLSYNVTYRPLPLGSARGLIFLLLGCGQVFGAVFLTDDCGGSNSI